MAERTSTRAHSRRNTPQPAQRIARAGTQSPSRRTTRITRSQSHDVSDSEDRMNAWKGTERSIPDGAKGTVGQNGSRNGKGRPANRTQVQQDLSVVDEGLSVVYPELKTTEHGGASEHVGDAGSGQLSTQQNEKSPGGLSAISGTTARISFPTQELTEISPEDMVDTLPDLSDTSDKLLSFVIPAELSEASIATSMVQLQNKNNRECKKLKRLGDTFERQRKEYGGNSYINVGDTLRRLLGRKAGPINERTASWRPDALLQKANLAVLLLQMMSTTKQDQKEHYIEEIAGTFPQPFLQRLGLPVDLTPECSALAEATFQLALEVRTQEAIMVLARHVGKINFDPDTAVLHVFFDGNKLKGWAVSGLQIRDLTKEAENIILGRVEQLRDAFRLSEPMSSDGQSSSVKALRESFSWATFAQQIFAWAGQRLTEIEIQTTTFGGAQNISQRLSDIIQSGMLGQPSESGEANYEVDSPGPQLDLDAQSESRATSEQQDALGRPGIAHSLSLLDLSAGSDRWKAAVALLKKRETRKADLKDTKASEQIPLPQNQDTDEFVLVASTAGSSMRVLTPQRIQNDQVVPPAPASISNAQDPSIDQNDNRTPEDHGEEERDIVIERNSRTSLEYRKRQEAESNKENVTQVPESQQVQTPKNRSMYDRDPLAVKVSQIDSPDSAQQNLVFEISSDEGFQHQAGPSNAARQRSLKPATKRPASELARSEHRSPKKVRVQADVGGHTIDGRTNVTRDEQEIVMPLSQAYDEYERVKESAKQRMAVVAKPPQSRSAWTRVETDMLHYLITNHGTSWKLLKQEDHNQGHILVARDQVALKDKARNMKMDYLKAGRVLPPNFERIPLSQPQIKRLMDGGIEYDPETGTRVDAEVID